MPIEFPCTNCNKTLQTADDTAGKAVVCPDCGFQLTVPASAGMAPVPPPPGEPPSPGAFAHPNPYQPPESPVVGEAYLDPSAEMAARVAGPGIALIVAGAFYLLGSLGAALLGIVGYFAPSEMSELERTIGSAVWVAMGAAGLLLAVVIIIGGVKMKGLRSYPWAMTASIIAMMPVHCCCILGLPIGVWSLATLADVHVHAAFRS